MERYNSKLAKAAFDIGAVKVNCNTPFQWSSGFHMPVYNDTRIFLGFPEYRNMITLAFMNLILEKNIPHEIMAGVATAGISYATTLADRMNKPLVYVREKPKAYGLKTKIEGIAKEKELAGKNVVIIEDVISTGKSSINAINSLREGKCLVDCCLAVFNYGFKESYEAFYSLRPKCNVVSLLDYDSLIKFGIDNGKLTEEDIKSLEEWKLDPFKWGEKRGFPKN